MQKKSAQNCTTAPEKERIDEQLILARKRKKPLFLFCRFYWLLSLTNCSRQEFVDLFRWIYVAVISIFHKIFVKKCVFVSSMFFLGEILDSGHHRISDSGRYQRRPAIQQKRGASRCRTMAARVQFQSLTCSTKPAQVVPFSRRHLIVMPRKRSASRSMARRMLDWGVMRSTPVRVEKDALMGGLLRAYVSTLGSSFCQFI